MGLWITTVGTWIDTFSIGDPYRNCKHITQIGKWKNPEKGRKPVRFDWVDHFSTDYEGWEFAWFAHQGDWKYEFPL